MNQKNLGKVLTALAFGVTATSASADGFSVVQAPSALLTSPVVSLSFPGVFGVPSAVAPKGGSGFVGLTYVNPRGGVDGNGGDASVSAGYTVGNPIENVSVTFGVSVTGTQPFGDAGSLSVSASRLLQAGGTSATFIGASASNIAKWGPGSNHGDYSVYVSHLASFDTAGVEVPLQFVAGYGTNNTRNSAGGMDNGAFAGVGAGLTESLSGSISFTSTQVNAGVSVGVPNTNIGATIGVFDVSDNNNRRQLSVSIGLGF